MELLSVTILIALYLCMSVSSTSIVSLRNPCPATSIRQVFLRDVRWILRVSLVPLSNELNRTDVPFGRRSSSSLFSSQHTVIGTLPSSDQDNSFLAAPHATTVNPIFSEQPSPPATPPEASQSPSGTVLCPGLSFSDCLTQILLGTPSPKPTLSSPSGPGILFPTRAPDPPFRHIRVEYMAYTEVVYRGCNVPASFRLTLTANGGPCINKEIFPTGGSFVIATHGAYGDVAVKRIGPTFEHIPESITDFLNSRRVCCNGFCTCADGSSPQGCYPSPCSTAARPCDAGATCVDNSCGRCNAEWLNLDGREACL